MKVTMESAPDSEVILTVEVEETRMEQALDRAYRQVVKRVNIPGFRRGKAPRHIVERHVGRGRLLREAVEPLLQEVYEEAIRSQDLHPISSPQAEMMEVDPPTFRFTVCVRPTIELGDYHALRFSMPEVTVEESEVDEVLQRVRRDHATWAPADGPAQIGDRLLIDVAGGVPGGFQVNRENEEVLLADPGEGMILGPGVIEGLVGVVAGETRTIPVRYPEDATDEDLAGQTAMFTITVRSISEQELPPLDDDLAAAVGEFENLAALRDHVRKLLLDNAETRARNEVLDQMMDALAAGATLETPAVLIEAEIEDMLEELQRRLQQRGLTLERYMALSNTTLDELRAQMRDSARERVRRSLVVGTFARLEELDPSDAEVDAEIERLVAEQGEAVPQVRAVLSAPEQRDRIANQLLSSKIGDRLIAIATSVEQDESANEETSTGGETPAAA